MKVTLTNLGAISVPLSSTNGDGFVAELKPGEPYAIDSAEVVVATAGDNPSFQEDLYEGLRNIAKAIVGLLAFWRTSDEVAPTDAQSGLRVKIENHGTNAVRVRQGDDVERDIEVGQDEMVEATSPNYIELRELGVG